MKYRDLAKLLREAGFTDSIGKGLRVMTDSTITVTAKRWTHGWELHIGSEDVTQVGSLAHADQQIRDYLDTMDPDVDHSQWTINLVPDQGYEGIPQAR